MAAGDAVNKRFSSSPGQIYPRRVLITFLPIPRALLSLDQEAYLFLAAVGNPAILDGSREVRNAYAMVGRSGIGTDVSQIDQEV